jgi:putative transposon-encoded protein
LRSLRREAFDIPVLRYEGWKASPKEVASIAHRHLSDKEINIYYVHTAHIIMVRRMIATITQIESVVTPSGNSGHVVVPKAWIGKEAIVTLKEKENKGKGKKK